MSFDKAYPNRKDWRKPYVRRSGQSDRSCRNHGSCPYCENNRLFRVRQMQMRGQEQLHDFVTDVAPILVQFCETDISDE